MTVPWLHVSRHKLPVGTQLVPVGEVGRSRILFIVSRAHRTVSLAWFWILTLSPTLLLSGRFQEPEG